MKTAKKGPHRRRRAAALAFALIMTICLSVAVVAVLSLAGHEHRMTMRGIILREANNAVESTINNGIAQIVAKIGTDRQYDEKLLRSSPLVTPSATTFGYGYDKPDGTIGSDAYIGDSGLAPVADPAAQVTLLGGIALKPTALYTVPVDHPSSVNDPFAGQAVVSKTFPLLATVTMPVDGTPITVRAKAELVVRDVNLFSYAIFYNTVPLEMAPGGPMIVNGNIRANSSVKDGKVIPGTGDFYMGGASGTVSVLGNITSSGDIRYGRMPKSISGQDTTAASSAGVWYVPFRDANGNGSFDNVTGVTYNATDPDKNGDPFNYSGTNSELVSMKIVDAAGNNIFLDSTHKDKSGVNDWRTLSQTVTNGSVQDSSHGIEPAKLSGFQTPDDGALINQPPLDKSSPDYDANKESVKYSNKAGLYLVVEPDGSVSGFQNAKDASAYKAVLGATPAATRTARDDWKSANAAKVLDLKSTGAVKTDSAFLDRREKKNVAAVDIDVGALRSYINGTSATPLAFNDGPAHTYPLDTPDSAGWNGVMYVDVENPNSGWKTDNAATTTMTAVKIINAAQVPNRAEANAAGTPGFTLATNAALYTVGNVNADGDTATGSNSMPDSGSTSKLGKEAPVSFAADAITTLSKNWRDADSFTISKPAPVTTEISAALLVGIVKSADGAYSGGVENFPRLLEGWDSSIKLRIRGSMVAMFESKYATGRWNQGVYGVPSRDWGFSSIFASGAYPPGSPTIRSSRRINYRVLSADEYAAELGSTWTNDDGTITAKFP